MADRVRWTDMQVNAMYWGYNMVNARDRWYPVCVFLVNHHHHVHILHFLHDLEELKIKEKNNKLTFLFM